MRHERCSKTFEHDPKKRERFFDKIMLQLKEHALDARA